MELVTRGRDAAPNGPLRPAGLLAPAAGRARPRRHTRADRTPGRSPAACSSRPTAAEGHRLIARAWADARLTLPVSRSARSTIARSRRSATGDRASDIYSLGIVLYELLSARPGDAAAVARPHLRPPPPACCPARTSRRSSRTSGRSPVRRPLCERRGDGRALEDSDGCTPRRPAGRRVAGAAGAAALPPPPSHSADAYAGGRRAAAGVAASVPLSGSSPRSRARARDLDRRRAALVILAVVGFACSGSSPPTVRQPRRARAFALSFVDQSFANASATARQRDRARADVRQEQHKAEARSPPGPAGRHSGGSTRRSRWSPARSFWVPS
jgi:hypothetical protein